MGRLKVNEATAHTWESNTRVYVRWQATDSATFGALRSSFRATFPRHGDAIWLAGEKAWSLPQARRWRLIEWLYQEFEPTAVQEDAARDEWAWDAPRPSAHRPLDAAYAVLHLRPTAPPELVTAAYRLAAQANHPDRGGSNTAMAAVNEAAALIRSHQVTSLRG